MTYTFQSDGIMELKQGCLNINVGTDSIDMHLGHLSQRARQKQK